MKKHIKILNMRYLDYDGAEITIGGVQTYITNLAKVAEELNMQVEVFQFANQDFDVHYRGILVHGVGMDIRKDLAKKKVILYHSCMKTFHETEDILIFGTDLLVMKTKKPFAIAIQHGIGWDIEDDEPCSRMKNVVHSLRQFRRGLFITKRAANVKTIICVDYNYINWYRTQILHHEMDYRVIPNFTLIPPENSDKYDTDEPIRIIFARRFVKYRGTRLFASAIERLMLKHDNLEITFAGDGPEEEYLRKKFDGNKNVHFIAYKSDESLTIHQDKHIAVIPTVGSEGTSLSLLEAMASTCAVVCTNIGGMTNIVIDNYNGLMVNPDVEQLYGALEKLIEDKACRKRLAQEAYHTAQYGFSFDLWKQKWIKVLSECE